MTDRLLARVTRLTRRRLDVPREPVFDPGARLLSWKAPAVSAPVTHYRIRLGSDSAAPDYEVSAGNTSMPIPAGVWRVFLSAYNSASGAEGPKLELLLAGLVPEVPDVKFFRAGTASEDGKTYTAAMHWDDARLRMLTDLGVMAPDDRRNWSGVQFWIKKPKVGGGYDYVADRAPVLLSSFLTSKDGDIYYRDTLATQPGEVPDPQEDWTFTAVSLDANRELKRDGDGKPTGRTVTLKTLARTDDVTNFTASVTYLTTEGGQAVFRISGGWTDLTTKRYKAVRVVMRGYGTKDETLAEKKEGENEYQSNTYSVPDASTPVTIYAQTIFGDGTAKEITEATPHVNLTLVKQVGDQGAEWTANVTGINVTVDYPPTSDGTHRARVSTPFTPPSDAKWGGVELVIWDGSTERYKIRSQSSPVSILFAVPTSLQSWSARMFSFDTNGRRNTYRAGVTPEQSIAVGSAAGTLKLNRADPDTYELTQFVIYNERLKIFQIEGDLIVEGTVESRHLKAQGIEVGGGEGARPAEFRVYNLAGQQIGFIGVEDGFEGGWFKKLGVGGYNPASPVISADGTAVTIANAEIVVTGTGFAIDINPAVGLAITSSTNGRKVTLTEGNLTIEYLGTLTYKGVYNALGFDVSWDPAGYCGRVWCWAGNTSSGLWLYDTGANPSCVLACLGAASYLSLNNQQVLAVRQAAVVDPAGGSNIDAECRAALCALLARCRTHGLIAS